MSKTSKKEVFEIQTYSGVFLACLCHFSNYKLIPMFYFHWIGKIGFFPISWNFYFVPKGFWKNVIAQKIWTLHHPCARAFIFCIFVGGGGSQIVKNCKNNVKMGQKWRFFQFFKFFTFFFIILTKNWPFLGSQSQFLADFGGDAILVGWGLRSWSLAHVYI